MRGNGGASDAVRDDVAGVGDGVGVGVGVDVDIDIDDGVDDEEEVDGARSRRAYCTATLACTAK